MAVPLVNLAPNLTVSRLCFGTMTFGEQNSMSQSFRLLDQAFDAGINFFDSAEMYPVPQRSETQGRSEEYLGHWIRSRKITRDRIVIATKVAGPSGQMTWIRDGPKCLDTKNITEAIDARISLLAYSPLAMGILSGKYFSPEGGPADARLNLYRGRYLEGESRYNLTNNIIRTATMEYVKVAKKYGLHPVSLAIAFVLRHPLVASVVFGVTKSWQLLDIVNAVKVELTPEIISEIDKIHSRFPNPCP
ncbi:Protein tas, partial [Cucurbita argyrosperma subsp. sororia]